METTATSGNGRAASRASGLVNVPRELAAGMLRLTSAGLLAGTLGCAASGAASAGVVGGLMAGALLGLGLLLALCWELDSIIRCAARGGRLAVAASLVFVKYPLVGVVLYALIEWGLVDPRALGAGFVWVQVVLVVSLLRWLVAQGREARPAGEAVS